MPVCRPELPRFLARARCLAKDPADRETGAGRRAQGCDHARVLARADDLEKVVVLECEVDRIQVALAVELSEERRQHLLAEVPTLDIALAPRARLGSDDAAGTADQPLDPLGGRLCDKREALLRVGLDGIVELSDHHVEEERRQRQDKDEQRADRPMMEPQPQSGEHREPLSFLVTAGQRVTTGCAPQVRFA